MEDLRRVNEEELGEVCFGLLGLQARIGPGLTVQAAVALSYLGLASSLPRLIALCLNRQATKRPRIIISPRSLLWANQTADK